MLCHVSLTPNRTFSLYIYKVAKIIEIRTAVEIISFIATFLITHTSCSLLFHKPSSILVPIFPVHALSRNRHGPRLLELTHTMHSPRLTNISTSNRALSSNFILFMLDKRHRTMRRNGVLVKTNDDVVVFAEIAIQVFESAVGGFWLLWRSDGELGRGLSLGEKLTYRK